MESDLIKKVEDKVDSLLEVLLTLNSQRKIKYAGVIGIKEALLQECSLSSSDIKKVKNSLKEDYKNKHFYD